MAVGVLTAAAVTADPVQAQTVANGPYYAMPSWDQTLPSSTRFIVLSNFNSQAVLDRETGLVWERSPATTTYDWNLARYQCVRRETGGRNGWRLASVHELASLIDPSQNSPALPPGHPFSNVQSTFPLAIYWSASTNVFFPSHAWYVDFSNGVVLTNDKSISNQVWCVRGGNNADQY
jgi:hypothetical protein